VVPHGVVYERAAADGRVAVPHGVVFERAAADGRVLEACVAFERVTTVGRVTVHHHITERISTVGRVKVAGGVVLIGMSFVRWGVDRSRRWRKRKRCEGDEKEPAPQG